MINFQVLTLLICNFFALMGYSFVAPLFPVLAKNHGINEALLGYIISVYPVAETILTIKVPILVKKYTRKKLLNIATFFQALCCICYGLTNKLNNKYFIVFLLFFLRTVHGFASGITSTIIYSLGLMIPKDEKESKKVMSYLAIAANITFSVGPVLASLFYHIGGFSFAFYLLGLIILCNLICLRYLETYDNDNGKKEDEDIVKKDQSISIWSYFFKPDPVLLNLLTLLMIFEYTFYYPVLTNHLISKWGCSVETSSFFFMMPSIFYIAILFFLEKIVTYMGGYILMLAGSLILIVTSLCLYPIHFLPQSRITILVGLSLNGFVSPFILVTCSLEMKKSIMRINRSLGKATASDIASAVYNIGVNIGDMGGPIYGGMVSEAYGFDTACIGLSLGFTFSCVVFGIKYLKVLRYEFSKIGLDKNYDKDVYGIMNSDNLIEVSNDSNKQEMNILK